MTIKQIAKKAGFSPTTVSRLLNHDQTLVVTDTTRKKIMAAVQSLGYQKKEKVAKITRNIALLLSYTPEDEPQDIYFNTLAKNVVRAAEQNKMHLVVFNQVEALMGESGVFDGFIGVGTFSPAKLKSLHRQLPYGVFIDSNPAPHDFDSVQPDFPQMMIDALNLFIAAGKSKIGFVGGNGTIAHAPDDQQDSRGQAYASCAIRLHVYDPDLVFTGGTFTAKNGYKLGRQIVEKRLRSLPDGFLIASDALAVGVLRAFYEAGIIVPRDTSVISINNFEIAKYVLPPLTTYDVGQRELCRMAVKMLDEAVNHQYRNKRHLYVDAELVVRKSFVPMKKETIEPHK
ncbi:MAG: LacI family DNA-binding transcriptional regulator [Sporolactobacillus sp.]|nr:LacI family DNA-binding transcriptional regulator [Sporolactobacillus sp.]